MGHASAFLELVNDAKSRIRETDTATVKQHLDNKDDVFLIDVREECERIHGYIPGAIHISKGVLERDIEKVVPNHAAHIILYCGGGYRSALAADSLQGMGFTNVISMDGGFSSWSTNGYPVEY
jgi:rhodanese-related sulfurtransferase